MNRHEFPTRLALAVAFCLAVAGCSDEAPVSWCDGVPSDECANDDDCAGGQVCGYVGIECVRRACQTPWPNTGGQGGAAGLGGEGGNGGKEANE